MGKIYIDVSKMSVANTVPSKYRTPTLKKAMQEATARMVNRSTEFTTKEKSDKGFEISYRLASVTGGTPVRCTFKGVISKLPNHQIITQALSGGGNATPPYTVEDVAIAVCEDLTKRKVLPALSALLKKR